MTNKKRTLVTSALPYSNGRPHVGHLAGAYLPANIYVRFLKLKGTNVKYVCGSDDHGVAIMLKGIEENKNPAEIAKHYHDLQEKDFKELGIDFDVFSSTSANKYHEKTSQDFFLKLYEKGYFSKKTSRQFFDEERSMFLPDRFVEGTCTYCDTEKQKGDQCENCGKVLDVDTLKDAQSVLSQKPASIKESTHWFISLQKFEDAVTNWVQSADIRPQTRKYVEGLLSSGLVERAMTRDIDWGIPVPLEDEEAKGKVLYVWFDAPIGYISNTMELCEKEDGNPDNYKLWWKDKDTKVLHFIGEDNTIFHCIIWIAMLNAYEDYNIPDGVIVNHFLNIKFPGSEEEKISKSKGTAPWLHQYIEEGNNPDSLRYYLCSIAPEKARSAYNPSDLVGKHNSDLANTLGNFINRISTFSKKHIGDSIPTWKEDELDQIDKDFIANLNATHTKCDQLIEQYAFKQALETIMDFARSCNKYIDERAPWATRKTDMERTRITLAISFQGAKFLTFALSPFIPFTCNKLEKLFNINLKEDTWGDAIAPFTDKTPLGEPEILFEKIDPIES